MFDKKFNIILAVFLVLFAGIAYLSVSNNRLPFFTRATNKELDLSKSVVIVSKLEVIADANDSSTITVFSRNTDGVGMENRRVDISTDLGTLNSNSRISDNYGKTEFKILSDSSGTAKLSIQIDSQPITASYSIKFVSD